MLEGLFAKIAWGALWARVKTNASHDWQAIPPKVKLALLAIVLLLAGYLVHQHYAHRALKSADQAGYDRRGREDQAALDQLRVKVRTAEANASKLTQDIRNRSDEQSRASHAVAAAVLVRGPGAARCGQLGNPGLPASAGVSGAAAAQTGAAVDPVPDPAGTDLIAMPFPGAVAGADEHDQLLIEVKAWHEWYPKIFALYEQLRAEKTPATPPSK